MTFLALWSLRSLWGRWWLRRALPCLLISFLTVLLLLTLLIDLQEEDTRQVLNAINSKKIPSSLKELKFFLIPSSWMLKAYPMLRARQTMMSSTAHNTNDSTSGGDDEGNKWREKVGKIQNTELLAWDHAVSSSDDEEGAGAGDGESSNNVVNKSPLSKSKSAKMRHSSPDSCPIRRDLKHGDDFFLLGPNAWMLLHQKFGSDGVEIGRPCVFHSTEESTLAVSLDLHPNGGSNGPTAGQSQLVPVPPSGRFPYEKLVEDLKGDSQDSSASQQQPQQQLADIKSSDVVSDEEGEPNDLVSDPEFDPVEEFQFALSCISLTSFLLPRDSSQILVLTIPMIWSSVASLRLRHLQARIAFCCCLRRRAPYLCLRKIDRITALSIQLFKTWIVLETQPMESR